MSHETIEPTVEPANETPLAAGELERLRAINAKSLPGRWLGYASLTGPGWVQSAITLGASTATSSFYLGWEFGYEMLWVQVLGMLMGVVMFAAATRPALLGRLSFYEAMKRHVNPALAIAWALASIVASMVWCLNQYAAAAACVVDVGQAAGWVGGEEASVQSARWAIGAVILAISIPLTWAFAAGKGRGVRLYENVLKGAIFFMVACFAMVAWKTGIRWGDVGRGLIPSSIPFDDSKKLTQILGALGCAVGINMTFLFPITLRARGWGREHLGLARFDLATGMLLPFAVISTLLVIASANVLHFKGLAEPKGPAEVAVLLEPLFAGSWLPSATGRVLFDLGVAAMPLSTITILMLISGLALCEMLGKPRQGACFKLGSLLPAVGILGVAYKTPFWLGPLISSFALVLLPIAYIGFLILHNSRIYLGRDAPEGARRALWTMALGGIVLLAVAGAGLKLKDILGGFLQALGGS